MNPRRWIQDNGLIHCVFPECISKQIWTDPVVPMVLTPFRLIKQVHRGLGHPDHRGGDGGGRGRLHLHHEHHPGPRLSQRRALRRRYVPDLLLGDGGRGDRGAGGRGGVGALYTYSP